MRDGQKHLLVSFMFLLLPPLLLSAQWLDTTLCEKCASTAKIAVFVRLLRQSNTC
jgi:hypothetical protein